MENKVSDVQAINFINLFHTWRDEGNSRIQKNGVAILYDVF